MRMFFLSKETRSLFRATTRTEEIQKQPSKNRMRKESETDWSDSDLDDELEKYPLRSDPTKRIVDIKTGQVEEPQVNQHTPPIWLSDRMDRLGKHQNLGRKNIAITTSFEDELIVGKPWGKVVVPFNKEKQTATIVHLANSYNDTVNDMRITDRKLYYAEMNTNMSIKFMLRWEMEVIDYYLEDLMCCFQMMCDRELSDKNRLIDVESYLDLKNAYNDLLLMQHSQKSLISTLSRENDILRRQVQSRHGDVAAGGQQLGASAGAEDSRPENQDLALLPDGRLRVTTLEDEERAPVEPMPPLDPADYSEAGEAISQRPQTLSLVANATRRNRMLPASSYPSLKQLGELSPPHGWMTTSRQTPNVTHNIKDSDFTRHSMPMGSARAPLRFIHSLNATLLEYGNDAIGPKLTLE